MSLDESELQNLIVAMSKIVGLDAPEEGRAEIEAHLKVAVRMAALLTEFPIGDHTEPAAVFAA